MNSTMAPSPHRPRAYRRTGQLYPRPMANRVIWVQGQTQQMGAGAVRTWHLAEEPDETLCGRTTESMKAVPKAAWDQVLNPCNECQKKAELDDVHRRLAS